MVDWARWRHKYHTHQGAAFSSWARGGILCSYATALYIKYLFVIPPKMIHNPSGGRDQARNQLGTPGVAKSFLWGAKSFELCRIGLKYVQHIFTGGLKNLQGGGSPPAHPWLRGWPRTPSWKTLVWRITYFLVKRDFHLKATSTSFTKHAEQRAPSRHFECVILNIIMSSVT